MHLLRSSPVPAPEFVSLSLLLEPNTMDLTASSSGEQLVLVSPGATVSGSDTVEAVRELNAHLTPLLTPVAMPNRQDRFAIELLKEDERSLDGSGGVQVFRPLCGSGLGLHYRLVRGDPDVVGRIAALVLAANKNSATMRPPPAGVLGILFCVAISGSPSSQCTSPIQYFLSQRITDCVRLLTKISTDDPSAVKTILSTFLLSEDEHRTTNLMAEAANVFFIPDVAGGEGGKGASPGMSMIGMAAVRKRLSMTGGPGGGPSNEAGVSLAMGANSADAARDMSDRLTVMSVADDESQLRKYETSGQERRANLDLTGGSGKSRFRRRKADARDADLDGFDYKGPKKEVVAPRIAQPLSSTPRASNGGGGAAGAAGGSGGGGLVLKRPGKDTRSKGSAVPTLSAPRSDMGQRRLSNQTSSSANEDDNASFHSTPSTGRDRQQKGTPNMFQSKSSGGASARRGSSSRQQLQHFHDDEISEASRSLSHAPGDASSVASQARVQVNVALNEDLSCSYKVSQLSSCSVEGVVQVQVKSNSRSAVPFFLLLRDPSGHVESLQENKKFADDVSDRQTDNGKNSKGKNSENGEDGPGDRKFTVSVPKADNYFPVLRYKCVGDLRPVPIRVQTRVRVDAGFCRVALQISSNPNNEANLTDLTIIMGVPNDVKGDTLVTQPAGGVWNESKRSVIWCVSELGDGEKFQLQARFNMDGGAGAAATDADKPKFPVLVRCQCLFAQLSDIEIEVRDIPDVLAADVTMKLARRFRLSHRERS